MCQPLPIITNQMINAGQPCPFQDETLAVILNGDLSQETITILRIHAQKGAASIIQEILGIS